MGLGTQSCVSEHIRGGSEVVTSPAGFRQAGGRGSAVGKISDSGSFMPEKWCCSSSVLW